MKEQETKDEEKKEKKKIVFSGIQPSGSITIGNYLGALKNWVELQSDHNCVYCVVNQHAITTRGAGNELKKNTLEAYALLLACGVDPEKSTLFIQSQVPAHAELAWVLNCYTPFGELSRMTQFKDKSKRNPDNINAGLFTYPVLMAADILLYGADKVPVGEDQKQHLELARNTAQRFNSAHGNVFTVPEPYIPKVGSRIMSLQEPSKKMSKSDDNPRASVQILDEESTIIKKFKSAITDSDSKVEYKKGKDGINNLMTIYATVTGKSLADIEKEFSGSGYGDFKQAVGSSVANYFAPIRERYKEFIGDKKLLEKHYTHGAQKAQHFAARTLSKVYRKIGFID